MRLPNASTLEGVAAAVSEAAAPQGTPEKAAVLYRSALSESASIRTAKATQRDASHVVEGKVVKGVTATASAESMEGEVEAAAARASRSVLAATWPLWGCECRRGAAPDRSCPGAVLPGAPSGSADAHRTRREGLERGARGGRAPGLRCERQRCRRGMRAQPWSGEARCVPGNALTSALSGSVDAPWAWREGAKLEASDGRAPRR